MPRSGKIQACPSLVHLGYKFIFQHKKVLRKLIEKNRERVDDDGMRVMSVGSRVYLTVHSGDCSERQAKMRTAELALDLERALLSLRLAVGSGRGGGEIRNFQACVEGPKLERGL